MWYLLHDGGDYVAIVVRLAPSDWWHFEPRDIAIDALGFEFVRLYE